GAANHARNVGVNLNVCELLARVSYSRNGSMLFVAQSAQRSESLLHRIVPGMATTDANMVPESTIGGKDHTWNDGYLVGQCHPIEAQSIDRLGQFDPQNIAAGWP